jgi:hypothetical protein
MKNQIKAGLELPDFLGDPYELVGMMTDKGLITRYDPIYNCWSIDRHGQVSRYRQKQKTGKTRIVYPKIINQ